MRLVLAQTRSDVLVVANSFSKRCISGLISSGFDPLVYTAAPVFWLASLEDRTVKAHLTRPPDRLPCRPPARAVLLLNYLAMSERQVISSSRPCRYVDVTSAVGADGRLSERGTQAILRLAAGVPKVPPPPYR